MSDPLISVDDLSTYLNDPNLNQARAALMIDQAQALCESVVSPLPDIASTIVLRVAARAYTTVLTSRQIQQQQAGSPYGGMDMGAIRLWREDMTDLRRLNGGGGAFSIDLLPADYVPPISPSYDTWDER